MSRYIDAEQVKHLVNEHEDDLGYSPEYTKFHIFDFLAAADAISIPTIIRCKDCMYSEYYKGSKDCWCSYFDSCFALDDFCSRGRGEEE